jgi:transcription elongation factor GreA
MMRKVPMTVAGAEKLRQELQHLKTVERPRITIAIAEARAHGDLKENAEYHAAREQQSFTEGRILEIEGKLSNLQIIDVKTIENTGKVIFGVTVTVTKTTADEPMTFTIVGEDEADVDAKKISVTSPLARAMIGKFEGDVIEVHTPEGVTEYEIVGVEHI